MTNVIHIHTPTHLKDGELRDERVFEDRVRLVVLPLRRPERDLLVDEVHDLNLHREQERREVRPCHGDIKQETKGAGFGPQKGTE